jgi:hypothetical protein
MILTRRMWPLLVLPMLVVITAMAGCASSSAQPVKTHTKTIVSPKPQATAAGPVAPTGPLLVSCATDSSLIVWSENSGSVRQVAAFNLPIGSVTTFGCAGPATWRTVIAPEQFDKTFSRLAINFHVDSDNSNHVGWISRSGKLTDVTKSVSKDDDFSAVPQQTGALFDPVTGNFYYYDAVSKQAVWVNQNLVIAKKTPFAVDSGANAYFSAAGQLVGGSSAAFPYASGRTDCAPQASPQGDKTFIISTDTPAFAAINDSSFVQLANGRLEVVSADALGTLWNQLPSGEQRFPCGKLGTPITPVSDFTITSGAASKDGATVIFTADRGTSERTLFSVPANGSAAPTKLADLPQDLLLIGWH